MGNLRSVPDQLRHRAFTRFEARQYGVTDRRLDGPLFERIGAGIFRVRGDVPSSADVLRAVCAQRPGRVAAGISAALLWGLPLPWRLLRTASTQIHLALPRSIARVSQPIQLDRYIPTIVTTRLTDLELHTESVTIPLQTDPGTPRPESTLSTEIPVLSRGRTALQLMPSLWFEEAVAVLDHLVRVPRLRYEGRSTPHATLPDLTCLADALSGTPGSARLRTALAYARVGSDSPQETAVRLHAVAAGLPEPLLNVPIPLAPGRFARPSDGWWPEQRVAFDYQGSSHGSLKQIARDDRTLREFQAHGIRLVRLFKDDLIDPPNWGPPPLAVTRADPAAWHHLPDLQILRWNPAVSRLSDALGLSSFHE